MGFPVNFSTELKLAKAQNGKGYPYSIKAEDLMKNFVDAKLEVDDTVHESGLQLEEYLAWGEDGHKGRAIRLTGTITGGLIHPWRVTSNVTDPSKIDVSGGTVYHETGSIAVAAQSGIDPLATVVLKITRNASNRVVETAVVSAYSAGFTYESNSTDQYIQLATTDAGIIQTRFQDVYVFEDLAVVNGAFKLVPLEMSGPNFYDPP